MQDSCVIQKIITGLLTKYVLIHGTLMAAWSANKNLVSICITFFQSCLCISVTLYEQITEITVYSHLKIILKVKFCCLN